VLFQDKKKLTSKFVLDLKGLFTKKWHFC